MAARKKPESVSDTDKAIGEETERKKAEARAKIEGSAEPDPEPEPSEGTVIDLDDDDDDEPAGREPERASRGERRRDRYNEERTAREETERRLLEAERRAAIAEGRAQGYQEAHQRSGQAPPDPIDEEIQQIRQQRVALDQEYRAREARGTLTQEQIDTLRTKAYELADKEDDAKYRKLNRRYTQPQNPMAVAIAAYQEENRDVFGDEKKAMYARGLQQMKIAQGTPLRGKELSDECLRETRAHFGMNGRHAPSERHRGRFMGEPRSAGSGRGDGARKVTLTRDDMRMAEARWGNIPAKEAHKKMAQLKHQQGKA